MFKLLPQLLLPLLTEVGVLTRRPYRLRRDISTALPGSSNVRMLSGRLTLLKIVELLLSISQC